MLGNPVFFLAMPMIGINSNGRRVSLGSAVSAEAVAPHCRGKREKERGKGGQVSAVAL